MSPDAPGIAALLALRTAHLLVFIGIPLLTGAMLYVCLAEPGLKLRDEIPRRLLFAALGAGVVAILLQPRASAPGSPGRAFQSYVQGVLAARRSFATGTFLRAMPYSAEPVSQTLLDESIRHYQAALRDAPTSLTYARQLASLQAAAGKYDDARTTAKAVATLLTARGPSAISEAEFWRTAFSRRDRKQQIPDGAQARVADHTPGWFGTVLRYALARRDGDSKVSERFRDEAARGANRYMLRVWLAGLALLTSMVVGAILALVLLVLVVTGVLRAIPARLAPVSRLLWEAFILYMVISTFPALFRVAGRTPEALIRTALLTDLFSLLPILYLWFHLRRLRLSVNEIGFGSRSVVGDVLWGVAAYLTTSPLIRLVAIGTEALTERYFPNVAPPYHPVMGMMLGSQTIGVQVGLFVLIALGAPIVEEIFFRGALHGAIRRRLGGLTGAVLSSAVFAILHPQLPLGFIPIFLLGFTFAMLYEWRKSLIPGMVMHALNNGFIFYLMTVLFPVGA